MKKFGKPQSIKRVENNRFLNVTGQCVDDIVPVGALRAYVLRLNVAQGDTPLWIFPTHVTQMGCTWS